MKFVNVVVHRVNLIVSSSKVTSSVRKPASAGTSRGSCHAEGNETRDTVLQSSQTSDFLLHCYWL